VVLCTSLIDMFLKAGQIGRADQIWRHMQPVTSLSSSSSSSSSSPSSTNKLRQRDLDRVSRTLSDAAEASSSTLPSFAPSSSTTLPTSTSTPRVQPNVQTLSVMMQAHIRESDLAGVARIYQEILQHQHQHQHLYSSSISTKSALLNQVLTVLLNLGETEAAKEIYSHAKTRAVGQEDRHPTKTEIKPLSSLSRFTKATASREDSTVQLPIHQQGFHRRSTWRTSRSRSSTPPQSSSIMLRPDRSTFDLVLRHARRTQDRDWEVEILNDLENLQGSAPMDEIK